MADLEDAFKFAEAKFGISSLNSHQKQAISTLINERKDIFVNLPTGFGKSIIFQAVPLVLDQVKGENGHIAVVVSPLLSLIDDQVANLRAKGISAASISSCTEEEKIDIEQGKFSVVYGSPEAWIENERWRLMLNNTVYRKKLCVLSIDEAHVIRQWGTSQSSKLAAFRECYGKLHELRSLAPNIPMAALTATATKLTEETIKHILLMKNAVEIKESPNKLNICYTVLAMDKEKELDVYFEWLVDEIRREKEMCGRTIIYCQTIKQCSIIYGLLRGLLGADLFAESRTALVEMLHSCTPDKNKEAILRSFQDENGEIRVLVATIAFGMGVNCQGVHRVIHYGPSKNVEAFVQETGRAGRDGKQSYCYLLFHGMLLNHVEGDIKLFLKATECRREVLLDNFDEEIQRPAVSHMCCDICASKCKCLLPECKTVTTYPMLLVENNVPQEQKRNTTVSQRELVEKKLIQYQKSLLVGLVGTSANAEIKSLTDIQFMLGFSEHQISQVLDNLDYIINLEDVHRVVEIWDKRHAHKILSVVSDVFGDVNFTSNDTSIGNIDVDDDIEFDLLDEWHDMLLDDDLYDMVMENISLSQLDFSSILENPDELDDVDEDIILADLETAGL